MAPMMLGLLLHDLILGQASVRVGIHHVASAWSGVLDEAEAERPTAVLIPLEFGDGCFGGVCGVEANHAGAAGSAARFVLDLGLLHLSDGREQLDKVFIASGPRQLRNG